MTHFTRRSFLKLCGITLTASTLLDSSTFLSRWSPNRTYARTFDVTPIYDSPNGKILRKLFPDSVVIVESEHERWIQLKEGYVAPNALQPMPSWGQSLTLPHSLPALIEVHAPSATVYITCDSNSPHVTRIGHGGVMRAVDHLPEDNHGWFAVAHEDGIAIGWSRAERWHAIDATPSSEMIDRIAVNPASNQLTAWVGNNVIATFDTSVIPALPRGEHALITQQCTYQQHRYCGVPWLTQWSNDLTIIGAYWHNQFGQTRGNEQNAPIELSPLAAQWLYNNLKKTAILRIV